MKDYAYLYGIALGERQVLTKVFKKDLQYALKYLYRYVIDKGDLEFARDDTDFNTAVDNITNVLQYLEKMGSEDFDTEVRNEK